MNDSSLSLSPTKSFRPWLPPSLCCSRSTQRSASTCSREGRAAQLTCGLRPSGRAAEVVLACGGGQAGVLACGGSWDAAEVVLARGRLGWHGAGVPPHAGWGGSRLGWFACGGGGVGVGWRRCWLGARSEAGTGSETAIVCLKHMECHFAFRICQRGHTRVELLSKDDAAVQAAQYSVIVTHLDRHVLLPDDFSPVQHLRLPFSLLAALLGHPDLGGWPRCLATAASAPAETFLRGLEG